MRKRRGVNQKSKFSKYPKPPPPLRRSTEYEKHVNTYFHAKTIAEGCVNALWAPQNGRALHGKSARILRLSTIGPSIAFPRPAWGAGHPSSPLCAAIAAVELPDMSHFADGAFLDGENALFSNGKSLDQEEGKANMHLPLFFHCSHSCGHCRQSNCCHHSCDT